MKKKVILILLLFLLCLQNSFAFFVTDIMSIFNNAMVEIKNAAQRIQELFQWQEQIRSMNDAWQQIQRYYKELSSLPKDLMQAFEDITKDLNEISSQYDNLQKEVDELAIKADEAMEELNDDEANFYAKKIEEENKIALALLNSPSMTTEEFKKDIDMQIQFYRSRKSECAENLKTLKNEYERWKGELNQQEQYKQKADVELKKFQQQVDEQSKDLAERMLRDELSQKQLEQKSLQLNIMQSHFNSLQRKSEDFDKSIESIQQKLGDMEGIIERLEEEIANCDKNIELLKKEHQVLERKTENNEAKKK